MKHTLTITLVAALLLALLTVWQRAALVHAGAELAQLRAERLRLEEERQGLKMALARQESPRALQGAGAAGASGKTMGKDGWGFENTSTREVIQRARDGRKPAQP